MLAVQLYVGGGDLGALNLVSEPPAAFDHESEQVALLFAAHAAVAMAGAQQQEQLRLGINSRDLIGQAKSILMERFEINSDQARRRRGVRSETPTHRERSPRAMASPHPDSSCCLSYLAFRRDLATAQFTTLGLLLELIGSGLGVSGAVVADGDKPAARRALSQALTLNPAWSPLHAPHARALLSQLPSRDSTGAAACMSLTAGMGHES